MEPSDDFKRVTYEQTGISVGMLREEVQSPYVSTVEVKADHVLAFNEVGCYHSRKWASNTEDGHATIKLPEISNNFLVSNGPLKQKQDFQTALGIGTASVTTAQEEETPHGPLKKATSLPGKGKQGGLKGPRPRRHSVPVNFAVKRFQSLRIAEQRPPRQSSWRIKMHRRGRLGELLWPELTGLSDVAGVERNTDIRRLREPRFYYADMFPCMVLHLPGLFPDAWTISINISCISCSFNRRLKQTWKETYKKQQKEKEFALIIHWYSFNPVA